MTHIVVLGGTGYAGRYIVDEAARRGHDVVSVSRSAAPAGGPVTHRSADLLDPAARQAAVEGADVVVGALSPRGPLDGELGAVYRSVADAVAAAGARLVVVGGFSSLRPAPGEDRIIDSGRFPGAADAPPVPPEALEGLLNEARQMNATLLDLLGRSDGPDWTFVSPGMGFGAHVPGESTGRYRIGDDDVALFDAEGSSAIGGADFALAVVDEIEQGKHRREHIGVAY